MANSKQMLSKLCYVKNPGLYLEYFTLINCTVDFDNRTLTVHGEPEKVYSFSTEEADKLEKQILKTHILDWRQIPDDQPLGTCGGGTHIELTMKDGSVHAFTLEQYIPYNIQRLKDILLDLWEHFGIKVTRNRYRIELDEYTDYPEIIERYPEDFE